uniref:Uncharacterized protein n=1 Tax=Monodon monoceros TaxID=40151 RepID=A0A8C6AGB5_MONMO
MAGSKCGNRRLSQECLGQGAGASGIPHHRGSRYNSACPQPLHQVLHHDQGHTLQLPSAPPR